MVAMVDERRLPMNRGASLVDVLDRILDKGLVVAGDIKVSLADVELITIRLRLILCSVDKAEAIGMDWWRADPFFSSAAARNLAAGAAPAALPGPDAAELERRLSELDRKLERLLEERDRPAPGP